MQLSDERASDFAAAVAAAVGRADMLLAIDCIYSQLQDAIDLQKPRCDASGRCCRFEEYGHRLFVTTAEMAAFVTQLDGPLIVDEWDGTGCPHQFGGRCGVHGIRPFGCRVFFCDSSADEWQTMQYEKLHRQIKALHTTADIPYFYVEWREALKAVAGEIAGASRSMRTTLPQPNRTLPSCTT